MSDRDDGRDQRLGIEQYIDVNCNVSTLTSLVGSVKLALL